MRIVGVNGLVLQYFSLLFISLCIYNRKVTVVLNQLWRFIHHLHLEYYDIWIGGSSHIGRS